MVSKRLEVGNSRPRACGHAAIKFLTFATARRSDCNTKIHMSSIRVYARTRVGERDKELNHLIIFVV
jgi:hypothetical protein